MSRKQKKRNENLAYHYKVTNQEHTNKILLQRIQTEKPNVNKKLQAISIPCRIKLIRLIESGQTFKQASNELGIGICTAKNIVRVYRNSGRIGPQKTRERKDKDPQQNSKESKSGQYVKNYYRVNLLRHEDKIFQFCSPVKAKPNQKIDLKSKPISTKKVEMFNLTQRFQEPELIFKYYSEDFKQDKKFIQAYEVYKNDILQNKVAYLMSMDQLFQQRNLIVPQLIHTNQIEKIKQAEQILSMHKQLLENNIKITSALADRAKDNFLADYQLGTLKYYIKDLYSKLSIVTTSIADITLRYSKKFQESIIKDTDSRLIQEK